MFCFPNGEVGPVAGRMFLSRNSWDSLCCPRERALGCPLGWLVCSTPCSPSKAALPRPPVVTSADPTWVTPMGATKDAQTVSRPGRGRSLNEKGGKQTQIPGTLGHPR